MLKLQPLDVNVPIFQQLQHDQSPVVLVNIFQVAAADVPALLFARYRNVLNRPRECRRPLGEIRKPLRHSGYQLA